MEQKLIIAEILKHKPQGIKLYSPIFGDCTFCYVKDESSDICVRRPYNEVNYFNFDGVYHTGGECLLFPSNEMRDWSKFAWQKGDILVNENNAHIIFEKFTDDTYTTFKGRHYLNKNYKNYVPGRYTCVTQHFHIEESNAAQTYIYNVEEEIGGKLDLKTLEIEKPKCEFKPFDKVLVRDRDCDLWQISLFGYENQNHNGYRCSNGCTWYQCIPYEGNEHLLGTTQNERK
jgi:hypothetical protein